MMVISVVIGVLSSHNWIDKGTGGLGKKSECAETTQMTA